MTQTRQFLQRSANIFWSYPITWLPSVASGAVSFLFAFGCTQLRRPMIYALSPKSVLGGIDVQLNARVLFAGTLLQWLPMLLEVTAFVYGMGVTARLIDDLLQRRQQKIEWNIPHGFQATSLRTLLAGITDMALGVSLVIAFNKLWEPQYSREMSAVIFLVVGLPICWLIIPSWQHYCERNQQNFPSRRLRGPAYVGFMLGAAGALALDLLLSRVVSQIYADFHTFSSTLSFTLNLLAACLGQLAITFGFIALALPSESFMDDPTSISDSVTCPRGKKE